MYAHKTFTDEGRVLIILIDENGDLATINDSHPNFVRIAQAVEDGVDPSEWLTSTTDWFEAEFLDTDLDLYDDLDDEDEDDFYAVQPVAREGLRETIERYRREGKDATNLVRFMVLLSKNPSKKAVDDLFNWVNDKGLTIDENGYVIGYKSVTAEMLSHHSGAALVDGVEVVGQIPNLVGTVISMPRNKVADDANIGCSDGLHVGSYSYASTFGSGVLLEVRLDPADVVSVPRDCGFQKLRCCRYEVIAVHENPDDDLSAYEPESTFDEDEAMDSFMTYVPDGFLSAVKNRLFGRKNK
jgi:hypothetical protein